MEDRSTSLRELAGALKRGSRTLIVSTAVVIFLTGGLSLLVAPRYESQASVQVLDPEPAGGLLQDLSPLAALGLAGLGGGRIDTDMTVMRSRRVVEEVIDSLALHIDVVAPDTLRAAILQVAGSTADAVAGRYTLRRTAEGAFELRSAKVKTASGRYTRSLSRVRDIVSPPATILPGRPFEMGGMTLTITPPAKADKVVLRVRDFQPFVKRVRERDLKVRRPERGQIIHMDYRHRDPGLAAAAVNGIARSFLEYKLSTRTNESRTRVEILTSEVASYDRQIRELEQRLQSFQERELIIAPEEQATQQVRRVAELQVVRDAAIVEHRALTRILDEIASAPRTDDGESPYRRLATFPSFIANGAIQNLLQVLISVEDARAGLLVRRQPSNVDVRALTERIEELEQQLHRLARNYAASLESQIASAENSLSAFSGVLSGIPRQEIEYARLTRERMLLSEIYVTLQERLKEAEVLATIEAATGSVRILDDGLVPEKPVFPNLPVNLGLGAILGLMVGMMIVVARESASTRLWSKSDADDIGLTIPVLAEIPRMRHAVENGRRVGRWVRLPANGRAAIAGRSPLVTKALPASEAADAFRALRSSIVFTDAASRPQIVTLTSVTRREENSLGAANLALTLAQHGSKTLLIDSDLRGARLHEILATPRSPGLVEVALGVSRLEDAVRSIDTGALGVTLDFLPAGILPQGTADFLRMARAEQLLDHLRTLYEAIIIEAPPSDSLADAALLGRLSDTTIVVARAGIAEGPEIEDAVEQLQRLGVNVGGLVLMDV